MLCISLLAASLLVAEMRRTPGLARLVRAQVTLLALVLLFMTGAKAFLLFTGLPAYFYPLPAVSLVTAFVLERRVALAVNLFASAMFASLLGFDAAVFFVLFATSLSATLIVRNRKKHRAAITAGALSGWVAALAVFLMMLVFQGTISAQDLRDLLNPDYSDVLGAFVGGVLSGPIAWALIGPIGALAGMVGRGKLVDLQDLDHPVLKTIRDRAPGSWEHSRAAANLGEAAAAAIGANSLLVRVGAYFHDAGKTEAPEYYIENQAALQVANPHDGLAPEVSAECIFEHVAAGAALLRKHGVPEAIVEFAYTHHGTSLLEYFWFKNMEAGNPHGLRESAFCYPGMKPASRETAIVMIADAVEAASRTVNPPEKHAFESLVQRIVFGKLGQGQLDDCGISLAELKVVVTTMVETLVNAYHARIQYPWQRREETTGPQEPATRTGPQAAPQPGHPLTQTGAHRIGQRGLQPVSQTGRQLVVQGAAVAQDVGLEAAPERAVELALVASGPGAGPGQHAADPSDRPGPIQLTGPTASMPGPGHELAAHPIHQVGKAEPAPPGHDLHEAAAAGRRGRTPTNPGLGAAPALGNGVPAAAAEPPTSPFPLADDAARKA
jgi:hypothetical protein